MAYKRRPCGGASTRVQTQKDPDYRGPGRGKSVIALSVLGRAEAPGPYIALHATGSRAFTQTMRQTAGRGLPGSRTSSCTSTASWPAQKNDLDVLICDEAHRIRETSENRFTAAAQRSGRMQVDELIAAARVPVFLLDEHQVVKPGEMGTVEAIRSHAASLGFRTHHVPLDGQFRCGGSEKYERWVLRLLGLEAGGPESWTGDDHFEVTLAESPWELENVLRGKLVGRPPGPDVRRILLAVERITSRSPSRERRAHRRLDPSLERERQPVGRFRPAQRTLGDQRRVASSRLAASTPLRDSSTTGLA